MRTNTALQIHTLLGRVLATLESPQQNLVGPPRSSKQYKFGKLTSKTNDYRAYHVRISADHIVRVSIALQINAVDIGPMFQLDQK